MVIHVIGTVNGQVNEGMRNVATQPKSLKKRTLYFILD